MIWCCLASKMLGIALAGTASHYRPPSQPRGGATSAVMSVVELGRLCPGSSVPTSPAAHGAPAISPNNSQILKIRRWARQPRQSQSRAALVEAGVPGEGEEVRRLIRRSSSRRNSLNSRSRTSSSVKKTKPRKRQRRRMRTQRTRTPLLPPPTPWKFGKMSLKPSRRTLRSRSVTSRNPQRSRGTRRRSRSSSPYVMV